MLFRSQYPVTVGPQFNAVVDVLKMKMYRWKPEGGVPEVLEIPDSEIEKAQEYHNALVESAAEHDKALMEKFFDQGSLDEEEMRVGIRKGMLHRDMFPVFCVSAGKDMCVRRLMEFVGNVSASVIVTGTGQRGGNGAQYEVRVRYGEGTGKVRVGVMGYEAAEGLRVHGYVEAQGVLTLKKVLRGEYEELMSWSGEGQAGLIGKGYEVREQKFGLAGFREGGSEGIAVALKGEGYSGSLRAGIDGQVVGELSLREFEPGKVIAAEAGLVQELGGLRYTGDVRVGSAGCIDA